MIKNSIKKADGILKTEEIVSGLHGIDLITKVSDLARKSFQKKIGNSKLVIDFDYKTETFINNVLPFGLLKV